MNAALNIDDQREATSSNDNHRSGNRPSDDPIHRHHQAPPSSANSMVRTIGIMYVSCESGLGHCRKIHTAQARGSLGRAVGLVGGQLPEDFGLVCRIGLVQDARYVGELVNDRLDLCLVHARAGRGPTYCECLVPCHPTFALSGARGRPANVAAGT